VNHTSLSWAMWGTRGEKRKALEKNWKWSDGREVKLEGPIKSDSTEITGQVPALGGGPNPCGNILHHGGGVWKLKGLLVCYVGTDGFWGVVGVCEKTFLLKRRLSLFAFSIRGEVGRYDCQDTESKREPAQNFRQN